METENVLLRSREIEHTSRRLTRSSKILSDLQRENQQLRKSIQTLKTDCDSLRNREKHTTAEIDSVRKVNSHLVSRVRSFTPSNPLRTPSPQRRRPRAYPHDTLRSPLMTVDASQASVTRLRSLIESLSDAPVRLTEAKRQRTVLRHRVRELKESIQDAKERLRTRGDHECSEDDDPGVGIARVRNAIRNFEARNEEIRRYCSVVKKQIRQLQESSAHFLDHETELESASLKRKQVAVEEQMERISRLRARAKDALRQKDLASDELKAATEQRTEKNQQWGMLRQLISLPVDELRQSMGHLEQTIDERVRALRLRLASTTRQFGLFTKKRLAELKRVQQKKLEDEAAYHDKMDRLSKRTAILHRQRTELIRQYKDLQARRTQLETDRTKLQNECQIEQSQVARLQKKVTHASKLVTIRKEREKVLKDCNKKLRVVKAQLGSRVRRVELQTIKDRQRLGADESEAEGTYGSFLQIMSSREEEIQTNESRLNTLEEQLGCLDERIQELEESRDELTEEIEKREPHVEQMRERVHSKRLLLRSLRFKLDKVKRRLTRRSRWGRKMVRKRNQRLVALRKAIEMQRPKLQLLQEATSDLLQELQEEEAFTIEEARLLHSLLPTENRVELRHAPIDQVLHLVEIRAAERFEFFREQILSQNELVGHLSKKLESVGLDLKTARENLESEGEDVEEVRNAVAERRQQRHVSSLKRVVRMKEQIASNKIEIRRLREAVTLSQVQKAQESL